MKRLDRLRVENFLKYLKDAPVNKKFLKLSSAMQWYIRLLGLTSVKRDMEQKLKVPRNVFNNLKK